jgi:hypothetical protein
MRLALTISLGIVLILSYSCKKENDSQPYSVATISNPTPGIILTSPFSPSNNDEGQLLLLNERGSTLRKKETNGAALCFRQWNINGQLRYTYFVNDVNTYHIPSINQLTGYFVIADAELNELKRVHLLPFEDITTGSNKPNLDVHELILISDDHYYTMAYYPKTVSNIPSSLNPAADVVVVACIIQEVQNDQVVWQWDSSDYPEFYTNSVEGNDFSNISKAQDYMHMNSMIIDPRDGNLIVSSRNQNQIIKISKETGAVVWRLGGKTSDFELAAGQNFLRQHDATLIEDNQTLLLFDNGEQNERPQSRVVEFKLDEANKKVTSFSSFDIPEVYSQYMGSVQKIGPNYFIGGGSTPYILEINYTTGEKVLELKGENMSYRSYKY